MNHTFTSKTWGGNKPLSDGVLATLGIVAFIFLITIIGAPIGAIALVVLLMELFMNKRCTCPVCKKEVSVMGNAKAYSCYNCQSIIVEKNNQWKEIA